MENRLPRKLAAILYADVAGYSRLTGQDEEGTHRRLSEYLDVLAARVRDFHGAVVHFAGDAVLADFGTVTDAVTCAATIQRDLHEKNKELPDEQKVQFRIGINLGEVIVDRDDIYGDGVNVAARLESLAKVGGICISESVRTALGNKLSLDYESMGEQQVKNIAEPVKAYHVQRRSDSELPRPTSYSVPATAGIRVGKRILAFALPVVLAIAAALWIWQPWQAREEPASPDRIAFPLPEGPSIAVLPFDNLSNESDQDYFSDGLTDNVITTLSQLPDVFVIARHSTFVYKGRAIKVQNVAEELGVRYVLEGSVQRADGRVRVHAQFIDALTGHHLWAERFDRTWVDVFSLQDDITQSIVTALSLTLTDEEKARIAKRFTDDVEAFDLFLQGQSYFFRFTKADNEQARIFYERATERDNRFARAFAGLAASHIYDVRLGWGDDPAASAQRALEYARKAVALDEELPQANVMLGQVYVYTKRYEEALEMAERAVNLDSNFAEAYVLRGMTYMVTGRAQEAIPEIEKAMRLNPHPPSIYYLILGRALYFLHRYEEATRAMQRAVEMNPGFLLHHIYLAAVYAQMGLEDEAQWQEVEVTVLDPDFTIEGWLADEIISYPPDLEHLAEGLRKAGLPE